jgi:hypothetical protein
MGSNDNAFLGGFRLWQKDTSADTNALK